MQDRTSTHGTTRPAAIPQVRRATVEAVEAPDTVLVAAHAATGATLLLLLDDLGFVTWANGPGQHALGIHAGRQAVSTAPRLADLVHPGSRDDVLELLGRVRDDVGGEAVVRVDGGLGAPRFLSLRCAPADGRSGSAATLVQGWDVSPLVSRLLELRDQALRDPLTGLPNAPAFAEQLALEVARSARHGHSLALLQLEVERLDPLVQDRGRGVADRVLRMIAERMSAALRPGDTLARQDGHRFAAVCPSLEGQAELAELLDGLRAAASRPIPVGNGSVTLTLAVAAAFAAAGETSQDGGAALRRAAEHAAADLGRRAGGSLSAWRRD
jgi:diguanylate cyclase (GGDEF)-like protein